MGFFSDWIVDETHDGERARSAAIGETAGRAADGEIDRAVGFLHDWIFSETHDGERAGRTVNRETAGRAANRETAGMAEILQKLEDRWKREEESTRRRRHLQRNRLAERLGMSSE